MSVKECPVCFETYTDRIRTTLPCTHELCLACLYRLQSPQLCPLCRYDVSSMLPATPAASSPVTVAFNLGTLASREESIDLRAFASLADRIFVADTMRQALEHGAAPRNMPLDRERDVRPP